MGAARTETMGQGVIQISYTFVGHAPDAVAPLRVMPVGDDLRLTGTWPHRDLAAARRQVATYLATLPPETKVRCNFTGRDKSAASWSDELRSPPTVANVFEARHAIVEGRLFARLFGCYQLGESDIVLVADEASDIAEVYRFVTAWATYRLGALTTKDPEPAWDRPFPWGYWLVSFADSEVGDADFWSLLRDNLRSTHLRDAFDERMAAPAPRVVIEADDPGDPDTSYMIGATAALATNARQRQTADRHGADDLPSPSAQDAAGFCDRVFAAFEAGERPPFFAYREGARGPIDSGWRVACLDPEHRHDNDSLRIAPLSRSAVVPGFVDYLALPEGWVVTWEDDAFWTNAPGQEESHRDSPRTDGEASTAGHDG